MPKETGFVNIGPIIKRLVEEKKLTAKQVIDYIHCSQSNLFDIYKRTTVSIDRLLKFSQILETNLFIYYKHEEPLRTMFELTENEILKLKNENQILKNDCTDKDIRINQLNDLVNFQKNKISDLEKTG